MSAGISWFFLLCGAVVAAGSYFMHFGRHQTRIENSNYVTGSWIGYGHFGAVLGVIGLVGVILSILA